LNWGSLRFGALRCLVLSLVSVSEFGFCWTQDGAEFRAQITIDLGTFPTAEEAALAHDRAAVWTLGVMASTNLDKRKQLLGHGNCEAIPPPKKKKKHAQPPLPQPFPD
jgi:hypothetical protein